MSPIEKAIEVAGSVSGLARKIKTTPQAVVNWRKRGIPAKRVLDIERETGVPRHDLRPDLYPKEPRRMSDAPPSVTKKNPH